MTKFEKTLCKFTHNEDGKFFQTTLSSKEFNLQKHLKPRKGHKQIFRGYTNPKK